LSSIVQDVSSITTNHSNTVRDLGVDSTETRSSAMLVAKNEEIAPLTPVIPLVESMASSNNSAPQPEAETSSTIADTPDTTTSIIPLDATRAKSKKKKSRSRKPISLLASDSPPSTESSPVTTPSSPIDTEVLLTPNEKNGIDSQIRNALSQLKRLTIDPGVSDFTLTTQPTAKTSPSEASASKGEEGEVVLHMIRIRDLTATPDGRTRTLLVQAPKGQPLNLQKILGKVMPGAAECRTGVTVGVASRRSAELVEVEDPVVEVSKDRSANLVDMVEVPLPSRRSESILLVAEEQSEELDSIVTTDDTEYASMNASTAQPLHWAYQDDDTKLNPLSIPSQTMIDLSTLDESDVSNPESIEHEGLYAFSDDYDDMLNLDDDGVDTLREGIEERRSARDTLMKSSIHSIPERLRWVS
jgi:hypothetical protein